MFTHPIDALRSTLPAVFARSEVRKLCGGIVSPGHLANMDSQGTGPGPFYVGRRACYEKETFLKWLESQMKKPRPGKVKASV